MNLLCKISLWSDQSPLIDTNDNFIKFGIQPNYCWFDGHLGLIQYKDIILPEKDLLLWR